VTNIYRLKQVINMIIYAKDAVSSLTQLSFHKCTIKLFQSLKRLVGRFAKLSNVLLQASIMILPAKRICSWARANWTKQLCAGVENGMYDTCDVRFLAVQLFAFSPNILDFHLRAIRAGHYCAETTGQRYTASQAMDTNVQARITWAVSTQW